MLKIKLSRTGRKNQPYYRIIVAEARSKATGSYTDLLGHYNPNDTKNKLQIDKKKYDAWLKKGAQPTETIRHLVNKNYK